MVDFVARSVLYKNISLDNMFDEPFYWNNTNFMLNVEPSKIPNAGNGIVTYQPIEKETFIGYYDGVLKEDDGSCVGDYSFSLSKKWYIDSRYYPRAYVAMINDARGSKYKNNCEFRIELNDPETGKKRKAHDRKISLWAIRDIEAGEELFAGYGDDYWKYDRSH